jgi:uncharacterized protein YndB with AHSA1/START domain
MSETFSIVVTRRIQAAPAEVFRAFTHPTLLRDWLCDKAWTEPRPGGPVYLYWRDGAAVTGGYEQFDPPRSLHLTWLASDRRAPARLGVSCEAEMAGTCLSLTWESQEGGQGLGNAATLDAFWDAALENLVSVLETGIDLRIARRPRLGIIYDNYSQKVARKLGVPVDQGVLLHGTAEGSGARAAGLRKGDVLVSFNGEPLLDPNSFDAPLRGLKAGDRPVVEFYRGPEKHSVPLELGSFPIPDLPAEAAELAGEVRELHAGVLFDLRQQLAGLSDKQAQARPAEGEWSVNEQVAHFVLCERDYQSWVADMLNDTPVEDWVQMRPNVEPRIAALTARLKTLPALLAELAAAQEETAAMIAAFPASFARDRKHLYRRAAKWIIELIPDHYFVEHKDQFRATIEAVGGSQPGAANHRTDTRSSGE